MHVHVNYPRLLYYFLNAKDNNGQTPAFVCDFDMIDMLLKYDADFLIKDNKYDEPFLYMFRSFANSIINALSKLRPDFDLISTFPGVKSSFLTFVKLIDMKHTFPLAIYIGNLELIKDLIKEGLNVNEISTERYTPLCYAVYYNKFNICKYLIQCGADVNYYHEEFNIIDLAVVNSGIEYVKLLMLNGARISKKTFEYIIIKNDIEMLKYIVNSGYGVNRNSGTQPLIAAIYDDNLSMYIISKKANLNTIDINGDAALHHALRNKYFEIVKLLFDKGSNIKIKNKQLCSGIEALYYHAACVIIGLIHRINALENLLIQHLILFITISYNNNERTRFNGMKRIFEILTLHYVQSNPDSKGKLNEIMNNPYIKLILTKIDTEFYDLLIQVLSNSISYQQCFNIITKKKQINHVSLDYDLSMHTYTTKTNFVYYKGIYVDMIIVYRYKNCTILDFLTKEGYNHKTEKGNTIVHILVMTNNTSYIGKMYSLGIDFNICNNIGWSPSFIAKINCNNEYENSYMIKDEPEFDYFGNNTEYYKGSNLFNTTDFLSKTFTEFSKHFQANILTN